MAVAYNNAFYIGKVIKIDFLKRKVTVVTYMALFYHIWIQCSLHEVGVIKSELSCIANGVRSRHPHHGVRSTMLILQRAAVLKIASSG